jgi:hypothetical protein
MRLGRSLKNSVTGLIPDSVSFFVAGSKLMVFAVCTNRKSARSVVSDVDCPRVALRGTRDAVRAERAIKVRLLVMELLLIEI